MARYIFILPYLCEKNILVYGHLIFHGKRGLVRGWCVTVLHEVYVPEAVWPQSLFKWPKFNLQCKMNHQFLWTAFPEQSETVIFNGLKPQNMG